MLPKTVIGIISTALIMVACATGDKTSFEENTSAPQITMGNGVENSIQMEGLTRAKGFNQFSESRTNNGIISNFRGDSVALTFPEIRIKNSGFVVLHPVMDGRPNGDVVSGFTYLKTGTNKKVTVHLNTPADVGRKFLVMLHSDVDNDRVLDFVFVEDGINVEDTAVFEGTQMIAHIFAVPE